MAVEAVRLAARVSGTAFRTLSVHESRALLLYGIERRCPLQVVVGRAGSGKSRLLGALARTPAEGADLVLLRALPSTLEETSVLLARRFGVAEVPGASPLERLVRVADVLAERRRVGRLVALLLDDAHLLPRAALLDVRLLAGTDSTGGALLPIVIAGRPELGARLEEPALEPLRLAVSTRIELLRPLPAEVVDGEGGTEPPALRSSARRRWARAALPAAATLAAVMISAPPGEMLRMRHAGTSPPGASAGSSSPAAPFVTGAITPFAPAPFVTPASEADLEAAVAPPAARLTADGVRILVDDFGTALERRDLVRLERLLARDARQNGVRGRRAILESYAYRFARIDAPTTIGPPSRITLRDGSALVDVPFHTAYRDAGGSVGAVDGTLQLRIVRHADRAVVDTLDYVFAGSPP